MRKKIHKKPPRRVKSKKKIYQKLITITATLLVTILLASVVAAYFFIDDKEMVSDIQTQQKLQEEKNKPLITYEEKTKALEIQYDENIDNSIYIEKKTQKKEPKFHFEEPGYANIGDIETPKEQQEIPSSTIDEPIPTETTTIKTPKEQPKISKPKLAIIIDDVTTSYQVRKLLNLGYKINMSFLPPTSGHPNSAKIAQNINNYMIHLPLQASSFKYEEEDTLYTTDSFETIKNRIQYLKKLYPKAKYINNHTGSKFTANQEAMDKLFQVLKQENLTFVDSKTTPHSVADISSKKYGVRMLTRNIFLDNYKEKVYIKNQLQKAINIAKKYGTAIAIGHPYNATFETLKESNEMLEGLELVFVDQL